jgi:hypothetical protein
MFSNGDGKRRDYRNQVRIQGFQSRTEARSILLRQPAKSKALLVATAVVWVTIVIAVFVLFAKEVGASVVQETMPFLNL